MLQAQPDPLEQWLQIPQAAGRAGTIGVVLSALCYETHGAAAIALLGETWEGELHLWYLMSIYSYKLCFFFFPFASYKTECKEKDLLVFMAL